MKGSCFQQLQALSAAEKHWSELLKTKGVEGLIEEAATKDTIPYKLGISSLGPRGGLPLPRVARRRGSQER